MIYEGCSSVDVEQQFQSTLINTQPSSPSSWLHTPPTQMPWGVPTANQPSVMRFTGDSYSFSSARPLGISNLNFPMNPSISKPRSKRKSLECDLECIPPSKQLITDEKMAANLSGLHISNNYTAHQFGSSLDSGKKVFTSGESSNETRDTLPSLVLCEELRRLTSEPAIPPSLLNKIERPTNALVLWQPPGGSICDQLRMAVERSSSEPGTRINSCVMEDSQEEEDPQPSTSGLSQAPRAVSQTQNLWHNFVDNNNSSNAMDLNLLSPPVSSISSGLSADPSLMDDAMMDL